MKLVYVEWYDSFGCGSDWAEIDEAKPEVLICRSVGWLVYSGRECKLIVPHLSDETHTNTKCQGCGDMTIPSSAIKRMVELKEPER